MHHVTLIPGDGTGPELCQAARRCIDATGVVIQWEVAPAGADILRQEGTPLPQYTLESILRNKVALKGPTSTPPGTSMRSLSIHLRQELDLFACLRPCKYYPGVRSFFREVPVDLVVVRENTEDLYAGIEFEAGKPETEQWIETFGRQARRKIRPGSALSVKAISASGARRIVKFAFDYARRVGRRKVTAVHKANIMKATDGLFLHVAREVARDYPEIEFEDRIVDNLCMQLVQRPQAFDVLVLPNLYGDIVSDLAAGIIGGLGVAPGANIGEKGAIFEATHGSAPKYKGQNRVNPTALILSGMLLLRHLGEMHAAARLERSVADVLRAGTEVTYDLKADRNDPTAVGTERMTDAIISRIQKN